MSRGNAGDVRLGLCCAFVREPIRFRRTTARRARAMSPAGRRALLLQLAEQNAHALSRAIDWCLAHSVGAFRVTSEILPLCTHPTLGYRLGQLDRGGEVAKALAEAGGRARSGKVRLSFHPDQFVVPGSIRKTVVASSLAELEYQAEVAELIGAEQLTLHGGGAEGGKAAALRRLARGLARLSPRARSRIALENDDRLYTVQDLLPVCAGEAIPLVYDAHHHRCNPDRLSVEKATELAAATWAPREPWAHLSSPKGGWRGTDPRQHADHIRMRDFPTCWLGRRMTVDLEAKAKEVAVLRVQARLREWREGWGAASR